MQVEDRLLFLKYALPCAGTLVKRGAISQERVDNMVKMVSDGKLPEEGAEGVFKVAFAMCSIIAMRMGKKSIDADVIRQYFLMEHSKVVEDRFEYMRDFNPVACKTYAGKVVEAGKDSAVVRTALGEKEYRTVFARDVKKGDEVAVHYNFIIERIPDSTARRMKG
jgi:hypothetical protein